MYIQSDEKKIKSRKNIVWGKLEIIIKENNVKQKNKIKKERVKYSEGKNYILYSTFVYKKRKPFKDN